MKKSKIAVLAAAAMMVAAVFTGCSNSAKQDGNSATGNTITIGGNFELSGAAAAYGSAMQRGVQLAVNNINKQGGVKVSGKTYKFKLVSKDNKSDNSQAAAIASNLTTQTKSSAVIGPITSGAGLAAIPNYTKAKVPMVSPGGTQDSLTMQKNGKVQPYVFRSCFEDSYQGQALAKYVYGTMKLKRVAILGDKSTDYAQGLIKAFKSEYQGTIVATEYYQAGDKDFNTLLTQLKNKNFDALFVPGYYSEAGLIVRQAREMGLKQPIVGADGFADPKLVQIAGNKNATDVYYTTHFDPKAPASSLVPQYLKDYKAAYGTQAGTFDALSYDAVYMIKDAIQNEKSTNSVKIAAGLAKLKNFKGVTGTITIDKDHNPQKPVIIAKLMNGSEASATAVK